MNQIMKNIIITTTILSFLNLIGCYYQEQMIPSDYNFKDKEDMEVITKDTTFNLSGKDYYFKNDTLFATITKNSSEKEILKIKKSIPVDEIEIIKVDKPDALGTTFAVLGGIIGIALFVVIIGYIAGGGFYMQ